MRDVPTGSSHGSGSGAVVVGRRRHGLDASRSFAEDQSGVRRRRFPRSPLSERPPRHGERGDALISIIIILAARSASTSSSVADSSQASRRHGQGREARVAEFLATGRPAAQPRASRPLSALSRPVVRADQLLGHFVGDRVERPRRGAAPRTRAQEIRQTAIDALPPRAMRYRARAELVEPHFVESLPGSRRRHRVGPML